MAQRCAPRGASLLTAPRTLRIDRIAAGGDGVARDEGLVVFVPRTAPGDVIEAEVTHRRGDRFARGRLTRVVTGATERVTPACPHYDGDDCGGCQLQHLTYEAQVQAKAHFVAEAFRRIAKREIPIPVVHPSPMPWQYRGKMTLTLRPGMTGAYIGGLRPYDDPVGVFPLRECRITDDRVVQACRVVLAHSHLLPEAPMLRVAVRLLGDGVAMVVDGGTRWATDEALALTQQLSDLLAIWWVPEQGTRQLLMDRRGELLPGASFVQVNRAMATTLREQLVQRVMHYEPRRVIDGYAGAGDTAVALAERGVAVTAIERDRDAAIYATGRLAFPSRVLNGAVEEVLASALPADVVIINPPRDGVHEQVTTLLRGARKGPRAIFYVSCDPATLARDVGRLAGWRVATVTCFDMFPQTAHVESICELVPEGT